MKRHLLSVAVISSVAGAAHAQSSVTLYGLVDAGVNYVSNDNGKANWTMTMGVLQGNRFGFKGVEDLGGGTRAIFQLENGFTGGGALAQGGRLFGRQAWMGIANDRFGSLTMGRQYDSIVEYIQPLSGIPYTGLAHPFDNDNMDNSFRVNNSVKYTSPNFGGLKFGGMYAFSNTATTDNGSGFATNRLWSLGTSYTQGRLSVGAAYMHLNAPNANTTGAISGDYINVTTTSPLHAAGLTGAVIREDVAAAGVTYQLTPVTLGFVYSHSKFYSASDSLRFDNYAATASWQITPAFILSSNYTYTNGQAHNSDLKPRYHQAELIADYFLSKRTDVYLLGAWQHAVGDAPVASIAPDTYGTGGTSAPDASTTRNQVLVRLAMRHKF
ncbi:porin [Caballeronia novacaledonica]|uniref:Porin n=1 Tax=Caballeronia novacaledonica TaxID=1544861 RepID=A0AA37I7W4_9BURK|nr:porin [Caballeronia novacaledonica]GJH10288.1 porin [Caballeronia novacaledonica]GJH24981.1 porin [Caballeronia novacaledonica]